MYNCKLISVKNNKADSAAVTSAKESVSADLNRKGINMTGFSEVSSKDIASTVFESMRTGGTDMFIFANAVDSTGDEGFRKSFYDLIRQLEGRVVTNDDAHKGLTPKLKISSIQDLGSSKGYCFSLCGVRFIALPGESTASAETQALIDDAVKKSEVIFQEQRINYPEGIAYVDPKGVEADSELNRTVILSELKAQKKQGFIKSFIPLKEDSRKMKIRKIIVLIAIAVFIGALIYVLNFYIFAPMANNAITSEIQSIAYKTDSDGEKKSDGPAQDWDALKEVNDEIVGWISIPDTVVDYPVLEHIGDDRYNQYYIDRSYKKDGTEYGSIFVDYRSTDSTKSRNVIMHGHNMRDGSQFHTLLSYSHEGDLKGDLEYYRDHPTVIFNTPDGDAKYKIISVFKTSTRYEHGEFFNYMQGEFNSDAEFMNFVYNMRIRSMFDIPVTVNENDQIITLSTCCYEFYEWRCVLVARKVRPGEDEKVDTDLAQLNPSPLFPDVYYERYGGTRPDPGTFKKAYKDGKVSWYDGKGNLEGSEDLTATLAANPTEPPTEKPKPGETKATEPPMTVYYPITYRNYDGSQYAAYNVKEGDPLPTPDGVPVMPEDDVYRYEFAGWNLNIEGVDFNSIHVGLDIYPIFNSIPK